MEKIEETLKIILNSLKEKEIPVGISNRHIHLSKEGKEKLFGKGYEFQKLKDLTQNGQYAAKETVTLIGKKGIIENVRVLGPERKETQVEISKGDSVKLGIQAPVRDSGDLIGTPGLVVLGPNGCIELEKGVIIAKRHIHMSEKDAEKYRVRNGDLVNIEISGERGGELKNTLIRVNKDFSLECHLDIEEANAMGVTKDLKIKIK